MMTPRFFLNLSFSCLVCLVPASADTILLNDGKSIEGKVIYEDATYYLLEVQVSEGIKDEKKVLKSDVKSISKLTPDIAEFEKLKEFVPTPDLLGAVDYEVRIKKLEDFIKKYPSGEKLAEARKMVGVLKEELKEVSAGGIKFSGKMVPANEYLPNAFAYDESISAQKITRDINSRNLLGALRSFTEYELNFANGKSRADLLPKIKQVLQIYKSNLSESLAGYDSRIKARDAAFESMTAEDRKITERALQEEAVSLKARFDREKSMKNTWITPHENLKESITEAVRQVDNEIKRLDAAPKNDLVVVSLDEEFTKAWNSLPTASEEDRKKILEELKRNRMPEHYMAKLRARMTPQ
jgi:hypothetical protein